MVIANVIATISTVCLIGIFVLIYVEKKKLIKFFSDAGNDNKGKAH